MANPLFFSNQFWMNVLFGTQPVDPTPTAQMTLKNRYNCHQESIQLHKASPIPKRRDPIRKTHLAPHRSTRFPTKGPMSPWRIQNREKAPAVTDRLQPNSLRRATKKTEKEYMIVYVRARVVKLTPTMIHLRGRRFSFSMEQCFAGSYRSYHRGDSLIGPRSANLYQTIFDHPNKPKLFPKDCQLWEKGMGEAHIGAKPF